jgi:hypothetical protein
MNVFICGFVPSLHTMIVISPSILILAVITYKFFMKRDVEGLGEGHEDGCGRPGRGPGRRPGRRPGRSQGEGQGKGQGEGQIGS